MYKNIMDELDINKYLNRENEVKKMKEILKSFEINNSGTETSRSTNSTMSENLKKTMQEKTQYTQK